jgi:hypothetical protein
MPNFIVRDFKILGSDIYFCGQTNNQGFVAKTTINNLFSNASFDFGILQQTLSINKIQVYYDNTSNVRIVGIGCNSSNQAVFVDCNGSGWNYDVYQSPSTTEIFDDIILQNNEVITIGRPTLSIIETILGKYYKNNMSSMRMKIYQTSGWRFMDTLVATTIGTDSIAIVGECTDYEDNNLVTIALIVNINTGLGTTHFMAVANTQQVWVNGRILEMLHIVL